MLLTEVSNGIATLTLNRPDAKNALNPELISQLTQEFKKLSSQAEVRVVVLKGAGSVFCAGADLKNMQSMIHFTFEQNKSDAEHLFAMFDCMEKFPKPIISVIHGAAYGGALGFLPVSDVTLVEEQTQFCFSEVKLGIVPAIISHFLFQKFARFQLSAFMTSGKIFTASEAMQKGLVTELFKTSDDSKLQSWIKAFKDAGPEAIATTKNLIRIVPTLTPEESHRHVVRTLAEKRVSSEGQEGLKSFFEKRNPSWRDS